MVAVQSNNVSAVNEALNEIYVEEEDYERLRESIDLHDSFDQIGLAQKVRLIRFLVSSLLMYSCARALLYDYVFGQIEKHELLEMRRVAAYIYKKAGRWKQSIGLSKKDKLYKDAMETASQSGERELAEELLVYFIEQVQFIITQKKPHVINTTVLMIHEMSLCLYIYVLLLFKLQGKKECFASCLFVCYDLIRPDTALELAWMNNMIDFAFPYLLQVYFIYLFILIVVLNCFLQVKGQFFLVLKELISCLSAMFVAFGRRIFYGCTLNEIMQLFFL